VKRQGREADQSSTSIAEVKECVELYLQSPNTPSWLVAQVKKSTGTTLLYLVFIFKLFYFRGVLCI